MAYSTTKNGSDRPTGYVMEAATGKRLPDVLRGLNNGDFDFTLDGKGFVYHTVESDKGEGTGTGTTSNSKAWYHRLGEP